MSVPGCHIWSMKWRHKFKFFYKACDQTGHAKEEKRKDFQDRLSLNAGQKYCRMLPGAFCNTLACIKLPPVFKTFILCIFSSPERKAHMWAFSIPMLRRPSSVRRPSVHIFKHLLLRNRLANQNQILCGASWVGGTKVCSQHPGHMTKMATTPIYGKTLQKSSPEPADRFPRNLVFSIGDSCLS